MGVIVDTCVWSLALRRNSSHSSNATTPALIELIQTGRIIMLGLIRQELLSGIRDVAQFEKLRGKLREFPDFPVVTEDYETAAEFSNRCRAQGIQGSNTDFLICAIAIRSNFTIYTVDKDFERYRNHIPFRLYNT